MSYEGHIQILCTNGHPAAIPISYYGDEINEWRCRGCIENKLCGEPAGWSNSVDDTNCESYGHHEMIEVSPQEIRTCDLGHLHVWTVAAYKPSEKPYWFHQELGWMEINFIKCPKCGIDARKSVSKNDPNNVIIDCGECHNRKILETKNNSA